MVAKIYIVFGVSGCGKTTVGELLAQRLGIPFFDADDYHPQANIDKMTSGIPLTDVDRVPWLDSLHNVLIQQQQLTGAVLACSALKEIYRTQLAGVLNVHWIHLNGSFKTIHDRVKARNHYMPESLLQSQFDTLETPNYGLTLEVSNTPEAIVDSILDQTQPQKKASFGIFGLGVMGRSLALNMAKNKVNLAVYNRSVPGEETLVDYVLNRAEDPVLGFDKLNEFVKSLESPRKILLMIPAGDVIDTIIEQLLPLLNAGDIIIDGGNSHFKDTQRRCTWLANQNIHFLGMGVSGGEQGALHGPSLMPGGSSLAYTSVKPYLETIAAKDSLGNPCCSFIGQGAAGHFVKMIHNGIEYAEMQLIAELSSILKDSGYSNEACATLFEQWNSGEDKSYLLGIMPEIFRKKESDTYLLELILDKAGNKGTGAWSSITALEQGTPATIMTAAVFARYTSAQKSKRERFNIAPKTTLQSSVNLDLTVLRQMYLLARKLNHLQGLELIMEVSNANQWDVNLQELTRIWSAGCIIKSELLNSLSLALKTASLEEIATQWLHDFISNKDVFKSSLNYGFDLSIPLPCISASYQYGMAITQKRSNANIIQAQRDYFGAHTYKRIDKPETDNFHTNWTKL